MSIQGESESYNPLSEFFEQAEQEEEIRRRNRFRGMTGPRWRQQFNFANRQFRRPRMLNRRFIRPFPRRRPRPGFGFPRPFPYPYPYPFPPPVEPTMQGAGAMPEPAPPYPASGGDPWGQQAEPQGPPAGGDQPSPNGNGQSEPGGGDAPQATDAQQAGGAEEYFAFGGYEREAPAPGKKRTINLGEVVICGGTPFAKLDDFVFGQWTLRNDGVRNHPAQVDTIAREIIRRAKRRRPVPTVCVVGHTDFIGRDDFNYELGMKRARSVKDALCKKLGRYASTMTFVVNSLGETDPSPRGTSTTARAQNRRVEVFLLSERLNGERCNGGGGYDPPDERCGVPRRSGRSGRRELEMAQELHELSKAAPARRRGAVVRPKLSLYLNADDTSERNHFHHQAQGTARRIGAIEKPNATDCKLKVGPTPYGTGADIISAIRAASACTKKKIETVHIFGHSNNHGIAGNTPGRAGIRQDSLSIDRADGGRHISEIPTDVLSNNVIFILHGCRQAEGCNVAGDDDNFAQSLYDHLKSKLSNPRVYGHYNRGCAGRNNSWCLYSKTHPKGKARLGPPYVDPGGCRSSSRELEFEWEG